MDPATFGSTPHRDVHTQAEPIIAAPPPLARDWRRIGPRTTLAWERASLRGSAPSGGIETLSLKSSGCLIEEWRRLVFPRSSGHRRAA